jgi:hypothetical protein
MDMVRPQRPAHDGASHGGGGGGTVYSSVYSRYIVGIYIQIYT